jgi:hypothetical protein
LSELSNEFKTIKTSVESWANYAKETKAQLEKHGIEIRKMDRHMTKMYTHCKGHLGSSNMRSIEVERQLLTLKNAPRPQIQDGDVDFSQNGGSINSSAIQSELQKLRNEVG